MRRFIALALLFVGAVSFQACESASANSNTEFWVRGNCGMCEERIVETLTEIDGVSEASWDKESGMATVSFDEAKTNEDVLQNAVATVGHATKSHEATEAADKALPKCCRAGGKAH